MNSPLRILYVLVIGCWSLVNVEAQPAFPTNIVVTLNQKGQVSLAWDRAASHSNVTFCVLIGVKSGVYNVRQDAGTNVTTVVTNLSPSLYFFTVIAKNQAGLESDPSNEVSYEVTKPLAPSGIRTTQINTQLESSMFPEGPWTKILSYQPTSFMVSSDHRFFRARLMIDVGQIIHE